MRTLLSLSVASVLAATASAQATFTIMGTGDATAMNSDGTAVVGRDNQGAFLWTQAGGYLPLGESDAVGVSEDGTVVAGNMTDSNGMSAGGVWTQATGWVSVGGLGGSSGTSLSTAYGMSRVNGSLRITGLGWINAGTAGAFDYDVATGAISQLPQMGPNSSRGNCVSGDASTVGGWDEDPTGPRRAAVWDFNLIETLILAGQATNMEGIGEVFGLSTDGTWAVGGEMDAAYRWSAGTGIDNFGPLPNCCGGFFDRGSSEAVSDNGNVVVGRFGSGPFSFVATIWTPTGGYERLDDFLVAQGADLMGNMGFAAVDISPDGSTILGTSVAGGFQRDWFIATIDGPIGSNYCGPAVPNSTGNSGTISATGSASVAAGNLTLTASDLPNNAFGYFVNSMTQGSSMPPGSSGILCLGGSVGRHDMDIQNTGGSGSYSISVDLTALPQPTGAVMVMPGDTWNFQGWHRDMGMGGMATSNFTDATTITFN